MKKLFKLFILAMLAVCGVACEPNDLVGGKTTFAISVTNITTTGATIDVVPSNNHTYYYFDVVQKIYFEEYATPAEFAYSRIEQRKEYAESQGVALVDALILGAGNYVCDWLTGDQEYYAYAFGITPDGELCTDVAVKPFTTLPYSDAPSDNKFVIEVSNITARGAKISVKPSSDDYYHFYAIEKAEYEKFESEEAFVNSIATELKDEGTSINFNTSSGNDSFVFNALLKPNTDYYAYAFGLSGNYVPTTDVTKVPFKTQNVVNNDTILNYFTFGYAMKKEAINGNDTATWIVALFAKDENNYLALEIQTPITAADFVGEYPISSSLATNSVVAGAFAENKFTGSHWVVIDNHNNIADYKTLASGSVKIFKLDNNYTLQIDALDPNNERVTASYTGEISVLEGSSSAASAQTNNHVTLFE